jgi:hypothetical protein
MKKEESENPALEKLKNIPAKHQNRHVYIP